MNLPSQPEPPLRAPKREEDHRVREQTESKGGDLAPERSFSVIDAKYMVRLVNDAEHRGHDQQADRKTT
jgi:hypothetical protein